MTARSRLPWAALGAPLLAATQVGCVTLDGFLFNGVPCGEVGPSTCEDKDAYWDKVCTPCEEAYAWDRDYDWFEQTLDEEAGESIRAIDPASVVDADVTRPDGTVLDAYLVPAHGDHPENAEVTLLYNHGNYAGIEHYLPRVRMAHEAGFTVLVWDYRGYGKTTDTAPPTPEVWWADAAAVRDSVDALAEAGEVPDADKVLVYANSLGALPALEMSLHRPGCALVFEAGFTSIEALTASNSGVSAPDSFFTTGELDNMEKISGWSGPFMAMIGTEDEVFREEDTAELVSRAGAPAADKELWVLEGVHHGITSVGVPDAGYAEWAGKLDAFLGGTGACR